MTILIVVLGISLLILVHELGHFIAAKSFGLLVEEFGFGFPPRLFTKKIGETVYSFNLLPFGGYVKIYGENRADMTDPNLRSKSESTNKSEFTEKGKIIEADLAYKINGILFETHKEVGRFGKEKQYADVFEKKLNEAGLNYKREATLFLGGENSNRADFIVESRIILEFKTVPFISKKDYYQLQRYLENANLELGIIANFRDEFLKLRRVLNPKVRQIRDSSVYSDILAGSDRSFYIQKAWKKVVIILAGVAMNFLLGWLIISAVFAIGAPRSVAITDVLPNTPAAVIGLQAGDILVDFKSGQEFSDFIQANKGREISLKINRGGKEEIFKAVPRVEVPAGQGALGVAFAEAGVERQPILQSLASGFITSVGITAMIFVSLFQLLIAFLTQAPVLANFVGPIGIFGVANQAGSLGLVYLLQLIGLISLNLFALNIFPFPALDGGRLLFILIEKIKGSPLSPKFEQSANATGFIFLILLMVVITVRDIAKLF